MKSYVRVAIGLKGETTMDRKEVFQDSVSIGYGSNKIWQCDCGRTEGYELEPGQAVLQRYPEEARAATYIVRDWELGKDWVRRITRPILALVACLNPDCDNFEPIHEGVEREFPTRTIEKKMQSGFMGTMPLKPSEFNEN